VGQPQIQAQIAMRENGWRPVPAATVNFAPLVGVTGDSPTAQIYFNAGWEF
jgi:hypothetical protein